MAERFSDYDQTMRETCAVCGNWKHPQDNVRSWLDRNGEAHLVHWSCRNGPTVEQQIEALEDRISKLEKADDA